MMKRSLLIALFCFFSLTVFAQSSSFLFHNTRVKQGLSFNFCHSLLRDTRGMLWIGTIDGLNRYDGHHFNQFHAGEDSNSFINNMIFDLCEDKKGNIWGATASGIFCYDVRTNKFTNYIPPGYDYARAVHNIICDQQGDIWATGLWTILKLNKKQDRFDEMGPLTRHKDSLGFYAVRRNGMVEDPSGKGFWMATRFGLHYYNSKEGKFYSYKNMPRDPLFARENVAALSLSQFGYCWFFNNTTREIIAFDPASRKILHRISSDGIIDGAVGQTLFEDSNHMLWFSTWNLKMAVIDYKKKTSTPLVYSNDNPLSIPGDNFWDAWEDEDKTVWLATGGGLSKCNYSKSIYNIYPVGEKVKEFNNGTIGTFSIDPRDSSWWMSVEGNPSLIHYYPETGNYTFYDYKKAVKNKAGLQPDVGYSIDLIDGKMYLCTSRGYWIVNESTKTLHPYEVIFRDHPGLTFNYFAKKDNNYWYCTPRGFIRKNAVTLEEKLIRSSIEWLPDSQVVKHDNMFFDRNNKLWFFPAFGWIGTINENDEVSLDFYVKNKPKELAAYIISLKQDSQGIIWMASFGAGLYRLDAAKNELRLLSKSEGIGSAPRDMLVDKQDKIWIASYNEFSIYDPKTGTVSQYHLPLYENTLHYYNGLRLGDDGNVMATLNRDIVKFIPDRLNMKPRLAPPMISAIRISGKEKFISDETALFLQPNENSLEFSFGTLINNEVFPYTFEYRLDGFDKQWIEAGNSAKALYSNLEPGKYTFRVKAISKSGSWQTEERTITIRIRTPFYKATWFWILIGSLLIASLIFFYRFRLNKQKQILTLETKAQQLEKEKTVVMYDSLKQQLNPHFLFNSLTSLSGLIETNQEMAGEFLEQMSGIYRYILKNGDNETVTLKDEIAFVKLYINLQQTRFKKGLVVNIDVPEEYLHFKIAPVTLQNLIENAIKHNIIDAGSPLVIDIFIDGDQLIVRNNLQLKSSVETSNKKGLAQFITLYSYLGSKPVQIEETKMEFLVKIPLL